MPKVMRILFSFFLYHSVRRILQLKALKFSQNTVVIECTDMSGQMYTLEVNATLSKGVIFERGDTLTAIENAAGTIIKMNYKNKTMKVINGERLI